MMNYVTEATLLLLLNGCLVADVGAFAPSKQLAKPTRSACQPSQGVILLHSSNNNLWVELEDILSEPLSSRQPSDIDSVLDPETPSFSEERPTLFRERHKWCPYSERAELMLELGDIPYDTIRIDNTGGSRPSYYGGGTTPQLRWPDGRMQGESMDIVEDLDQEYNCGLHSDQAKQVTDRFRNIFPQRARPSSRAAFLFQYNGDPLWKATFEETLMKTDELIAETPGLFIAGDKLSTADISWAPFLERYRYQLPCLHSGLDPNDTSLYPHLAQWFGAMDNIPAYVCRCKGDASSWRKVLSMAGFGNAGLPPTIQANVDERQGVELKEAKNSINCKIWQEYSSSRSYVADSPHEQAAATIVRNREALVRDAVKQLTLPKWSNLKIPNDETTVEHLFAGLAMCLVMDDKHPSDQIKSLAIFVDDRMCVPRDMGAMPAACIKLVAHA